MTDDRRVVAVQASRGEDGEVGVVGQGLEHRFRAGVGRGTGCARQHRQQCGVRRGRAEGGRCSGRTPRLVIEDHRGAEAGCPLTHERLCAEQAVLLPVGEQDHQVVSRGYTCGAQRPRRLEQRADPDTVVRGTRRAGDGVVVRGEQHRAGRRRSRHRGDDVRDRGERLRAGDAGVRRPHGLLDLHPPPPCPQLREQVLAGLGVRSGARWAGGGRDGLDMGHRASGAEVGRGGVPASGRGRKLADDRCDRGQDQGDEPDHTGPPAVTALHRLPPSTGSTSVRTWQPDGNGPLGVDRAARPGPAPRQAARRRQLTRRRRPPCPSAGRPAP